MSACVIPEKIKVDGPLKKLVRRVVQEIVAVRASIRFDTEKQMWAVLDSDNKPKRHFLFGTMENVTFEAKTIEVPTYGCGGGSVTNVIGVATGDLRENTYGSDVVGYRNLSFDVNNRVFKNENGRTMTSVSALRLLPNRQSMYKA